MNSAARYLNYLISKELNGIKGYEEELIAKQEEVERAERKIAYSKQLVKELQELFPTNLTININETVEAQ